MTKNIVSKEYSLLLNELKKCVSASRYKAALRVNKELIILYHYIGNSILKSQAKHGWGAKIIAQLSRDLHSEFAEEYPDREFVQEVFAQLT